MKRCKPILWFTNPRYSSFSWYNISFATKWLITSCQFSKRVLPRRELLRLLCTILLNLRGLAGLQMLLRHLLLLLGRIKVSGLLFTDQLVVVWLEGHRHRHCRRFEIRHLMWLRWSVMLQLWLLEHIRILLLLLLMLWRRRHIENWIRFTNSCLVAVVEWHGVCVTWDKSCSVDHTGVILLHDVGEL